LGMGLPFALLAMWPSLGKRLPRPGAWMVKARQLFSFALLGTALWLISVFAEQTGHGLYLMFGHLGVALAIWIFTQLPRYRLAKVAAIFVLVVSLLLPL